MQQRATCNVQLLAVVGEAQAADAPAEGWHGRSKHLPIGHGVHLAVPPSKDDGLAVWAPAHGRYTAVAAHVFLVQASGPLGCGQAPYVDRWAAACSQHGTS